MSRGVALRNLLRTKWFPHLYGTRLASQAADGVFSASLASAVFFNPDHQTDPHQAAAGFVVLLLPYSLIGPFAGVFLDRWRRQRILVVANLVRMTFIVATAAILATVGPRGAAFYVAALAAVSVNRFSLAALSACLPHVVTTDQLILANSVTTTSGTVIAAAGGALGLAVRRLAGAGDHGSAIVAVSSCLLYGLAAVIASRIPTQLLGPDSPPTVALLTQLRRIGTGLGAGAVHVAGRPRARRALLTISASRLMFGLSTIGTLLLYRNYFTDDGVLRAGLVGLGQVFAIAAIGYVLAAIVTPSIVARTMASTWAGTVLGGAAVTSLVFGLPFRMAPLLVGAALLGFATSAAKICVDTIVQREVDDRYRGRVFSLYDTGFNLTFVAAAVIGAFTLPRNGKSLPMLIAISAGYAITAFAYLSAERVSAGQVTEAG